MKIVFLDIDGVILPVGALKEVDVPDLFKDPFPHLDLMASRVSQEAVAKVRELCEETGAKLVLISSWRRFFPREFNRAFLKKIGLMDLFHKDWSAGLKFSSEKMHDVGFWLDDHKRVGDNYIVIDDDMRAYAIEDKIVRPVSNVGFTGKDKALALALLSDERISA